MNQQIELNISFSSSEPIMLMKAISQSLKPFNQKLPDLVSDGYEKYTNTENWIDKLLPKYERGVGAYWGNIIENKGFIDYSPTEEIVKLKISDYELIDVESVMKMLASLPWTVATFSEISSQGGWDEYCVSEFTDFQFQHGWACAFKGEGHDRLVSRRCLEFGPWRLLRDEANDISFVQFHDLNTDPATALEQVKPGHRAMSIYGVGDYIDETHTFTNDLKAHYVPEERNMRVVIPPGKEITESEMSDYCAARHFQAFESQPFDTLSFVFIAAEEAQNYLHDLWLREIECFGITEQGVEVRLDRDYDPVPETPDWVNEDMPSRENLNAAAESSNFTTQESFDISEEEVEDSLELDDNSVPEKPDSVREDIISRENPNAAAENSNFTTQESFDITEEEEVEFSLELDENPVSEKPDSVSEDIPSIETPNTTAENSNFTTQESASEQLKEEDLLQQARSRGLSELEEEFNRDRKRLTALKMRENTLEESMGIGPKELHPDYEKVASEIEQIRSRIKLNRQQVKLLKEARSSQQSNKSDLELI